MTTKSNLVSGMGVALSLVQTLVASVRKTAVQVGISEEEADKRLHSLTAPEANGVWDKIASLIVEVDKKVTEAFTLVVDYGRSVKDGVKAGVYNYANYDITEEHFPAGNDEVGKKELQFTLYHFNKDVESNYAIAQMGKDGKRPATLRELLTFGEANPELQREFPIIALGSVWVGRYGGRCVAYLDEYRSGRCLALAWDEHGWHGFCRFLGVSK